MKCLVCHEAKMTGDDTALDLDVDAVFDVCDSCRADAARGRNAESELARLRAEQAEPKTCVWTYEAAWVSGCGLQYINAVIDADMKFCPFCGKRIEVKR